MNETLGKAILFCLIFLLITGSIFGAIKIVEKLNICEELRPTFYDKRLDYYYEPENNVCIVGRYKTSLVKVKCTKTLIQAAKFEQCKYGR